MENVEKSMYEKARDAKIAANNKVLVSMGLDPNVVPSVSGDGDNSGGGGDSDFKLSDDEQPSDNEQACANVFGVRVCNAHHSLHCYLHHTSGPVKKEAPPSEQDQDQEQAKTEEKPEAG